jgi:hypothetical protein
MNKNKKAMFWSGVALIVLIIGIGAYQSQKVNPTIIKNNPPVASKIPTTKTLLNLPSETLATTTPTSTPASVATSTPTSKLGQYRKPKAITPKALSYGEAVTKYGNLRIQFNPSCQAYPNQIAVANPVTIMLDNRSDSTQIISVAGGSYIVSSYNYVIVTINQKTLPVNLFINCNSSVNVAEIFLQK